MTDLAAIRAEHEHRTHGGRTNFIQVCSTCDAIRRVETLLDEARETLEPMLECPNEDAPYHTRTGCHFCSAVPVMKGRALLAKLSEGQK